MKKNEQRLVEGWHKIYYDFKIQDYKGELPIITKPSDRFLITDGYEYEIVDYLKDKKCFVGNWKIEDEDIIGWTLINPPSF